MMDRLIAFGLGRTGVEVEGELDPEAHLRLPVLSPQCDEALGVDLRLRGQRDVAEAVVADEDSLRDARQVEMLDLPARVVPPPASPDEPEVAGRPLVIGAPISRAGNHAGVVDIVPVRDIEADGAEASAVGFLVRDDDAGLEIHDGRGGVWRDEGVVAASLAERLERAQEAVVPFERGDLCAVALDVDADLGPFAGLAERFPFGGVALARRGNRGDLEVRLDGLLFDPGPRGWVAARRLRGDELGELGLGVLPRPPRDDMDGLLLALARFRGRILDPRLIEDVTARHDRLEFYPRRGIGATVCIPRWAPPTVETPRGASLKRRHLFGDPGWFAVAQCPQVGAKNVAPELPPCPSDRPCRRRDAP